MLQVYRDDEHASVAAPLLPISHDAETTHPRWSKQSNKNKNATRGAIATGAFLATYLFFCAWVAFANNGSSLAQRGDSTAFPHRRLPWPFPGRRHPHHPHHKPRPIVLGCTAIPTPPADATHVDSHIELNVTLPRRAVVLGNELLHGDVSVTKVNQSETEVTSQEVGGTMLVSVKVANRTWGHRPHPPRPEAEGEDSESTPESFLLCAITFAAPHPHPHSPMSNGLEKEEQTAETSLARPHPPPHHGHPFFPPPPVIVDVFSALNETYPKLPGPHGAPLGPPGPPELVEVNASTDSVLMTAWKSTISFLFPMLNVFPSHGHPRPPCHHSPPPPPPFVVTGLEVTLPICTRVIFGHGLPPHGPWRR